ncbi:hypothetical protein ACF1G0_17720 [Streptomyces sp. NPDC013953]|uniref:hypothetical protein n=1 Tax=Streptomyces sp. NPDC013953 TaxID=3364868 RepID=UPI0036F663D0
MSTTRHLINRQRRLASTSATRAPAAPPPEETRPTRRRVAGGRRPAARPAVRPRRAGFRGKRVPALLGVLTVLLGGFTAWAAGETSALRGDPAVRNTALTDLARTSEVKGRITQAVDELFSYNYAAPAEADRAVKEHLTGRAVEQHRAMLAPVRRQAAAQKLVLTTTVTESGVEEIHGDRARVLIYADQTNTRTAARKDATTYGAAMFAVEAVRTGGTWRIAAIDTLGAGT